MTRRTTRQQLAIILLFAIATRLSASAAAATTLERRFSVRSGSALRIPCVFHPYDAGGIEQSAEAEQFLEWRRRGKTIDGLGGVDGIYTAGSVLSIRAADRAKHDRALFECWSTLGRRLYRVHVSDEIDDDGIVVNDWLARNRRGQLDCPLATGMRWRLDGRRLEPESEFTRRNGLQIELVGRFRAPKSLRIGEPERIVNSTLSCETAIGRLKARFRLQLVEPSDYWMVQRGEEAMSTTEEMQLSTSASSSAACLLLAWSSLSSSVVVLSSWFLLAAL